ncbi:MAG: GGDEF domain-containing phosphodiesterase [Lachnospiraceae bacterium]|jgi:EAL domain-containing protein (putative c-di-GMP-specific phosphodiesterase class I)/GGDEF domain-containing protein|nr:GGDEF domain-containing phosphodiesterase [Lachnospiraceae bacterium]
MSGASRASHWGSKAKDEEIAYYEYYNRDLDIPNSLKLYKDLGQKLSTSFLSFMHIKGLGEIHNVYGREAGNRLLYQIVVWLRQHEKKLNFSLYSIKEKHFALLFHGIPQEDAIEYTNQIFKRFDAFWEIDRNNQAEKIYCRAAMGIAPIEIPPDSHMDLLDLIERIEYFANKESRLIFYDAAKTLQYETRIKFKHALKESILNDMQGFHLVFQPLVDADNSKWMGLEALCRWESPEVGEVEPSIFIEEAEKMGLIHLLGNWIFEQAISQVKQWKLDKLDLFFLFLNLSTVQLRDYDMLDKLMVVLNSYDFPPYKLVLDIKGTPGFQYDEKITDFLQQIQMNGITLSLEDFEVGRAAFSNIRNLPVYVVKTDREFINGLETDLFTQRTLQLMVEYAHATGLIVVAEGVETEEQLRIVSEKGANLIQGFWCCRPLSKPEVEDRLYMFHK